MPIAQNHFCFVHFSALQRYLWQHPAPSTTLIMAKILDTSKIKAKKLYPQNFDAPRSTVAG